MSKLPNAPLVEVIYEIRWDSSTPEALNKFDLLLGNMHSKLHEDFPNLRNLKPDPQIPHIVFLNQTTHRFSSNKNPKNYPLYQLGPGVLSVNTIDDYYEWENFHDLILRVTNTFLDIYSFNPTDKITVSLKYIDFYEVRAEDVNLYTYLRDNFHINIQSSVLPVAEKPNFVNFSVAHKEEFGTLSLNISTASLEIVGGKKNGLIIDSTLTRINIANQFNLFIEKWTNNAHTYLGDFFRKLTEGDMFNSFK